MRNTIRRDTLLRKVDKGQIEARCDFKFDDHYGRDTATREWAPARISRPVFEEYVNQVGNRQQRCVDHDTVSDMINLREYHFKGRGGSAFLNSDGTITLWVHSNLIYTLREIK